MVRPKVWWISDIHGVAVEIRDPSSANAQCLGPVSVRGQRREGLAEKRTGRVCADGQCLTTDDGRWGWRGESHRGLLRMLDLPNLKYRCERRKCAESDACRQFHQATNDGSVGRGGRRVTGTRSFYVEEAQRLQHGRVERG